MTAPGPLEEEARLLVEAAREWAARTFPDADAHGATGSAECCWCPLCRAVAAVRSPDAAQRVAGAVTAAASALAGVLDAVTAPRDPGAGPQGAARPDAGPPSGAARPRAWSPPVAEPAPPSPQPIPLDGD